MGGALQHAVAQTETGSPVPSPAPKTTPAPMSPATPSPAPNETATPSPATPSPATPPGQNQTPALNQTTAFPTPSPTLFPETEDGCWNNFTEIGFVEDYADVTQVRTYILCPNTTFRISSVTDDGFLIGDDTPLALRANMRVLCGEDGSRDNNCIVDGGSFAVAAFFDLYGFAYMENIFISGLTFNEQNLYGTLLLMPGTITFFDCVYKVRHAMVEQMYACCIQIVQGFSSPYFLFLVEHG